MGDTEKDPEPGHGSDTGRDDDGKLAERVRRRLADAFGDVLPDVTRDEVAAPDESPEAPTDDWLLANRPPHHEG
jgi:hypothetical protein